MFKKLKRKAKRTGEKIENKINRVVDTVEHETKRVAKKTKRVVKKAEHETKHVVKKVERETKHVVKKVERETKHVVKKVERETKRVVKKAKREFKRATNEDTLRAPAAPVGLPHPIVMLSNGASGEVQPQTELAGAVCTTVSASSTALATAAQATASIPAATSDLCAEAEQPQGDLDPADQPVSCFGYRTAYAPWVHPTGTPNMTALDPMWHRDSLWEVLQSQQYDVHHPVYIPEYHESGETAVDQKLPGGGNVQKRDTEPQPAAGATWVAGAVYVAGAGHGEVAAAAPPGDPELEDQLECFAVAEQSNVGPTYKAGLEATRTLQDGPLWRMLEHGIVAESEDRRCRAAEGVKAAVITWLQTHGGQTKVEEATQQRNSEVASCRADCIAVLAMILMCDCETPTVKLRREIGRLDGMLSGAQKAEAMLKVPAA